MFVCICNCLNDRQIDAAIDSNTAHACDVFRNLGCMQKCGMCTNDVQDCIDDKRSCKQAPQEVIENHPQPA